MRCKTWHYYDIPIRDPGSHAPKESNALKALTKARTDLAALEAGPTPDRTLQAWWLTWIEHLVGDLHQPLHCVSNYAVSKDGDAGGNLFMIKNPIKNPAATRPARLHGHWDGAITRAIASERTQGLVADPEEVSQRWGLDFAPSASDVANLDTLAWIKSGAALADSIVYVGIEQDQQPTRGYEQTQSALCKRQAVLAGARLAAILNDALGK